MDKSIEFAAQPVPKHVGDFLQHLKARQTTPGYRAQVAMRLGRMLRGLRVQRITDINVTATEALLIEFCASGIPDRCLSADELAGESESARQRRLRAKSSKTRDDYLDSLRHFCRWLVIHGRLHANPLASISKLCSPSHPEATATFVRRAMTTDEFARLVDAAVRRGVENKLQANPRTPVHVLQELRIRGEARALAYVLAGTLGVRQKALWSIQWGDLDLEASVLRLQAAYAKNRREARPDMPEWLRDQFVAWRSRMAGHLRREPLASERVFCLLPVPKNIKRLMDKDLEFAGIERCSGRERIDFHALKTYASTRLYEADVDPRVSAMLTATTAPVMQQRYARMGPSQGKEAVARLDRPAILPMQA
ncbi:MAG: tyrosine-type recombinase/integrase [Planctomycetota bacterium]